jgi:hypothetical protein
MRLKRFWIRFRSIPAFDRLKLGCGVTAHSYDDALSILRVVVFHGKDLPLVDHVIEDVDVRTLDEKHVIPNMEPPIWRGVWFPKGFAFLVSQHPPEVVEPLVDEVQNDPQLWALLRDRELERKELEVLAQRLGKRYDLEPEAFPPLKRPTNVEAIASFLEKRFANGDNLLAAQVAGVASVRARHELGLQS